MCFSTPQVTVPEWKPTLTQINAQTPDAPVVGNHNLADMLTRKSLLVKNTNRNTNIPAPELNKGVGLFV